MSDSERMKQERDRLLGKPTSMSLPVLNAGPNGEKCKLCTQYEKDGELTQGYCHVHPGFPSDAEAEKIAADSGGAVTIAQALQSFATWFKPKKHEDDWCAQFQAAPIPPEQP